MNLTKEELAIVLNALEGHYSCVVYLATRGYRCDKPEDVKALLEKIKDVRNEN